MEVLTIKALRRPCRSSRDDLRAMVAKPRFAPVEPTTAADANGGSVKDAVRIGGGRWTVFGSIVAESATMAALVVVWAGGACEAGAGAYRTDVAEALSARADLT